MGKLKRLPPPPGKNGYIGDLFTIFSSVGRPFSSGGGLFATFSCYGGPFYQCSGPFCPYGGGGGGRGAFVACPPPYEYFCGCPWLQILLLDAKPYSTSKMFIVNDVLFIAEMGLKL